MPSFTSYNILGSTVETSELATAAVNEMKTGGSKGFVPFNPTVAAGTWAILINDVYTLNMVYDNNASKASANDEFSVSMDLAAGTYTIHVLGRSGTDGGISDVEVGGVSKGTMDWYAGSTTQGVVKSVSSIAVATGGLTTIGFKMSTKHASSSAYRMSVSAIFVERTA